MSYLYKLEEKRGAHSNIRMQDIIKKSTLKIIDTEHGANADAEETSIIDTLLLSTDNTHIPDETELSGIADCPDGKSEE